jgi:hypothetical protein
MPKVGSNICAKMLMRQIFLFLHFKLMKLLKQYIYLSVQKPSVLFSMYKL